jgi:hypothetical protein
VTVVALPSHRISPNLFDWLRQLVSLPSQPAGGRSMNPEHAWRYTLLGLCSPFFAAVIIGQILLIQTNPEQVSNS